MWVKCAGSSRSMAPARMSCLPPCEREPSRLAILARMLEGGRENSRAREGIGSGARCAVEPPKRRLDGEESGLPDGGEGGPEFELAELAAGLTDRQIKVLCELGERRGLLM